MGIDDGRGPSAPVVEAAGSKPRPAEDRLFFLSMRVAKERKKSTETQRGGERESATNTHRERETEREETDREMPVDACRCLLMLVRRKTRVGEHSFTKSARNNLACRQLNLARYMVSPNRDV